MKTVELDRFRRKLEAEEQSLLEKLHELTGAKNRGADAEVIAELSSYDEHPADMASETFEKEKEQAVLEGLHDSLARVRNALAKIKRGTYGRCDSCGKPITLKRLRALPHATLCVECQGRRETT